jgi:hypothetical protein
MPRAAYSRYKKRKTGLIKIRIRVMELANDKIVGPPIG